MTASGKRLDHAAIEQRPAGRRNGPSAQLRTHRDGRYPSDDVPSEPHRQRAGPSDDQDAADDQQGGSNFLYRIKELLRVAESRLGEDDRELVAATR